MSSQLDLFSSEAQPAPDPRLVALATKLPRHVRFGTSSWTFEGWKGLVYRERYASKQEFIRGSLAEYARHPLFRTVGIDRSYYAPLAEEELIAYRNQLPPDFLCVSKVLADLTSYRFPDHPRFGARSGKRNPSFLDPDRFEQEVGEPTSRGLDRCAGPFLLQFPPTGGQLTARSFEDRLASFLQALAQRYAFSVEVRDPELLTERYFQILHQQGASHCFNYWSRMPPLEQQQQLHQKCSTEDTSPFLLVRLLLPAGARYDDLKARFAPFNRIVAAQEAMRTQTLALIAYGALLQKEVFVLVNNKAEGSSPLTIQALAELLAGS